MIQGSTVIFNDEYIAEVERHRNSAKKKYEIENMPEKKAEYKKKYEAWEQKLDWALNFQDTVDRIENLDVPAIRVCKTFTGLALPAKHLQAV